MLICYDFSVRWIGLIEGRKDEIYNQNAETEVNEVLYHTRSASLGMLIQEAQLREQSYRKHNIEAMEVAVWRMISERIGCGFMVMINEVNTIQKHNSGVRSQRVSISCFLSIGSEVNCWLANHYFLIICDLQMQ